MIKRFLNNLVFGCSIVAAAGVTACSSTDSTKPGASTPSARQASGVSESKRKATSPVSQAQAQTSLDALRRGESAGTPAGSPLKEIYFGFDRYDLSSDARSTLRSAGDWLRSNPAARVEIEGHCDERGTNEYNLALGAKRAQAAKDYLVSLGVATGRLSTISYGEEIPVCRDHSENCWQRNRRDRFVALPPKPGV
ncbi:MAG: peptidoglycan-associated lipoprotein Pal [Candidatus Binatia bacterium]